MIRAVALLLVLLAGCKSNDPAGRPSLGLDASDGRIVVEVLNGSNRTGYARRGTLALRAAGIDVVNYGTADTLIDSTLVLVRRGKVSRGRAVARALGLGIVREAIDTLRRVDVTVILGRDWKPEEGGRP